MKCDLGDPVFDNDDRTKEARRKEPTIDMALGELRLSNCLSLSSPNPILAGGGSRLPPNVAAKLDTYDMQGVECRVLHEECAELTRTMRNLAKRCSTIDQLDQHLGGPQP